MAAPTRTQILQNVTEPVFSVEIDTGAGFTAVAGNFAISLSRSVAGEGDYGTIPFTGGASTEQFSVSLRYGSGTEITVPDMTPIRVFCAWSGSDAVQLCEGYILDEEATPDTAVSWRCEGHSAYIKQQAIYTRYLGNRAAATRTSASSIEDPDDPDYAGGIINLILWSAGGRPRQQEGTYPSAAYYYQIDNTADATLPHAWVAAEDAWAELGRVVAAVGGWLYQQADGTIIYRPASELIERLANAAAMTYTNAYPPNTGYYLLRMPTGQTGSGNALHVYSSRTATWFARGVLPIDSATSWENIVASPTAPNHLLAVQRSAETTWAVYYSSNLGLTWTLAVDYASSGNRRWLGTARGRPPRFTGSETWTLAIPDAVDRTILYRVNGTAASVTLDVIDLAVNVLPIPMHDGNTLILDFSNDDLGYYIQPSQSTLTTGALADVSGFGLLDPFFATDLGDGRAVAKAEDSGGLFAVTDDYTNTAGSWTAIGTGDGAGSINLAMAELDDGTVTVVRSGSSPNRINDVFGTPAAVATTATGGAAHDAQTFSHIAADTSTRATLVIKSDGSEETIAVPLGTVLDNIPVGIIVTSLDLLNEGLPSGTALPADTAIAKGYRGAFLHQQRARTVDAIYTLRDIDAEQAVYRDTNAIPLEPSESVEIFATLQAPIDTNRPVSVTVDAIRLRGGARLDTTELTVTIDETTAGRLTLTLTNTLTESAIVTVVTVIASPISVIEEDTVTATVAGSGAYRRDVRIGDPIYLSSRDQAEQLTAVAASLFGIVPRSAEISGLKLDPERDLSDVVRIDMPRAVFEDANGATLPWWIVAMNWDDSGTMTLSLATREDIATRYWRVDRSESTPITLTLFW